MKHLSIDIETKSSVDIGKAGLYKYAQSEDFEILLLAYRLDNEPVNIVDFTAGEKLPEHIKQALADPTVMKHAYNAAFEVYCLSVAGFDINIDQWQCTMIHSMYCGYPASLEAAGKALGLPEDKQKEYSELKNSFKNKLYKNYADQVYMKNKRLNDDEVQDFDQDLFNYYINIFKQIEEATAKMMGPYASMLGGIL